MTHIRWSAAFGAVAFVVAAAGPAHAQGLIGKWSAEQGCDAQSRQIIFRGTTMELWEARQRLFTGNVRFQNTGNETTATVISIGRETPRLAGNPQVGDVATFRRDGNRMYPVAITRNGQRQTAPEGTPPFYLCP